MLREALFISCIFCTIQGKKKKFKTSQQIIVFALPSALKWKCLNLRQLNQTGLLGAVCKNRQVIYNLGQTSKNIMVIYYYFQAHQYYKIRWVPHYIPTEEQRLAIETSIREISGRQLTDVCTKCTRSDSQREINTTIISQGTIIYTK